MLAHCGAGLPARRCSDKQSIANSELNFAGYEEGRQQGMADWTVVRHKRVGAPGAGRRASAVIVAEQHVVIASWEKRYFTASHASSNSHGRPSMSQHLPLSGTDGDGSEMDLVERLLEKMRRAREKVEQSSFFHRFMRQMQDVEVLRNLSRSGSNQGGRGGGGDEEEEEDDPRGTFGEEGKEHSQRSRAKVELVVYGVGSITNSEISRCQLSLALLVKQKFTATIGNVFVYDPVMSPTDRSVMVQLGFSPLESNDEGRRPLHGPTLFYMPHCDVELYESVLQANLTSKTIDQMVILGNSFRMYQHRWAVRPLPHGERPSILLKVQPSVEEVPVADNFSPNAFNDTSWHFFSKVEF